MQQTSGWVWFNVQTHKQSTNDRGHTDDQYDPRPNIWASSIAFENFSGVRTGIHTEVSRYILGIGNTKQLTTNTIYRIGSLLYILARINILGGAPVVSMFGVNLIKCQHLKSCLTPIYCGRLNWWACLAPVLQNVNFSSHVWRQSYKMSTSTVILARIKQSVNLSIYRYLLGNTNTVVCSDIGNTNTSIHPVSYCPIWDEAVLIPDLGKSPEFQSALNVPFLPKKQR